MSITAVEVISHVQEAIDAKDEAVQKALAMCGEFLEGAVKDELSRPKEHADGSFRPNVDTGRLRNSITYATKTAHSGGSSPANPMDWMLRGEVAKNEVVVGTNVEYAAYVEMGTSKSRPYPYLKPSFENHKDTLKKIIRDELKS